MFPIFYYYGPEDSQHLSIISEYPYRTYYADGEVIESISDVSPGSTNGQLTCSVLSRPASELTLWHYDEEVKGENVNVSCEYENSPEVNCSLVATDFDFSAGFECKVKYEDPETGVDGEVSPEGCCEEPMYPKEKSAAAGIH